MKTLCKYLVLILVGVYAYPCLYGQTYLISQGGTITTCSGTLYDSGGASSDYGNSENYTLTICSENSNQKIQLYFSEFNLEEGQDTLFIFDGSDELDAIVLANASGTSLLHQTFTSQSGNCLTIRFTSDYDVNKPGFAATIQCLECQAYQNSISTDIEYAHPDSMYLDICPGTEINFTAHSDFYSNETQGYQQSTENTTYTWTVTRGYFDTIAEVSGEGLNTFSYSFIQPGGYMVRLLSEDVMHCQADTIPCVKINVSQAPSFLNCRIEPSEICPGQEVQLHGQIASFTVNSNPIIVNPNQCITDNDTLKIPIPVNFPDAESASIEDGSDLASVCLNIEHSWIADVWIYIQCPNGQQAEINYYSTSNPCSGDSFGNPDNADNCNPGTGYDYCWSMSATQCHTDWCNDFGETLPAGSYLPTGDFDDLIGCPINGEWKLVFIDEWGSDDGTIFSAELGFNPELFPETETWIYSITYDVSDTTTSVLWSGAGTSGNYGVNQVVAPEGENTSIPYVFSVTDNFGCTYETSLILNIRAIQDEMCCPTWSPEVCYVTTNSNNKAVLYWANPEWEIDSIYIYKEIEGEYQKISVIAGTASAYIDWQSKPHLVSEKYRISYWNFCNEESILSNYHKNMLLNLSEINEDSLRLNWSAYEGIDINNIKISRGSTPENINWLTTLPTNATEFIDDDLPYEYTYLYYKVDINYHDCSPENNDRLIRSNIATNNANYYYSIPTQLATSFEIFPNPAHNTVFVSFDAPKAKLSICDLSGKVLIAVNDFAGGEINIENLKTGVYVVKLETEGGVGVRKLLVE